MPKSEVTLFDTLPQTADGWWDAVVELKNGNKFMVDYCTVIWEYFADDSPAEMTIRATVTPYRDGVLGHGGQTVLFKGIDVISFEFPKRKRSIE